MGKSTSRPRRRTLPALAGAAALHGLLLAAALWLSGHPVPAPGVGLPAATPPDLVWIEADGPGGGGGGGGDARVDPPAPVQLAGHDERTVPAAATPADEPEPSSRPVDEAVPAITIPALTLASAAAIVPGILDAPPAPPTLSRGDGSGDGAGGGDGPGSGPGNGSGLNQGSGGGTGGDVYQPSNGVTMPRPIYMADPIYPIEAVRARVQGSVLVECIVRPNGVCTDARVVRSLAPSLGLEREAVAAALRWRFQPGMRLGEPVSVTVRIEVDFRIH